MNSSSTTVNVAFNFTEIYPNFTSEVMLEDDDQENLLLFVSLEEIAMSWLNLSTFSNSSSLNTFNTSSQYFNDTAYLDVVASPRRYYNIYETTLIVIVAALLSMTTLFLNLMVMISFKIDKQLQTISNYFLFSLAVADITIGTISMPLFTLYTLLGYWPLGALVCDTWLALDYLVSNASVLNLLIISFDRYFSVTRPLTYRAKRTTRRAAFMIGSAWITSLILWPPWIYSWPYIEGQRTVPDDDCYIQFIETNEYVTVGTAIAAFYLPVTVMCSLYWRIWRETEKRQKDLTNLQAGKKDPSKRSNSSEAEECIDAELRRQRSLSSTAIDEIETSYPATDHRLTGNKQKTSKLKRCCGLTCCFRKTGVSDQKLGLRQKKGLSGVPSAGSGYQTPCCNAGYHTPGSVETTVPQSVSHCSSINYIKDNAILPAIRIRSNAMVPIMDRKIANSSLRPFSQGHYSSTLPRTESGIGFGGRAMMTGRLQARSYSSDSVYTILIRLPNDPTPESPLREPSILMIEEEEASQASFRHGVAGAIHGKAHRKNMALQNSLETPSFELPLSDHSCHLDDIHSHHRMADHHSAVQGKYPSSSEIRLPLNAKIVSKQLARNSNSGGSGGSGGNAGNTGTAARKKKKKSSEKKQDRKAAKTLSAILLVFIITWTPYNVLVVLKTLLSCDDCIPVRLWHFAYYLCYVNSTVNPMCYALCNAAFRRTYIRILTCKWHNRRKQGAQRGYYS